MDIHISLPSDLVHYIEGELDSGRFASSSDVIGAALRLMEAQNADINAELARLQIAWKEGMESGDFQPLDFDAVKAEGRRLSNAE